MNIQHLDSVEAIVQHSVEYDVPESKELILDVFDELRKRLVAEEAEAQMETK